MKHNKQFIVLALTFLSLHSTVYSQVSVPFKVRYQSYVQGDMTVIANSIVNRTDYNNSASVPYHNHSNHALLNDQFNMEYIDIDTDPTTFSSSSATLSLENQHQKKVIYAALYWSSTYKYNSGIQKSENKFAAADADREAIEYIKIKLPNQPNYIDVKGEILFDGLGKKEFKDCAPYAAFADITDQINQLDTAFGEYTVANIRTTQGRISGGVAAGWTLFIVYRDLTMKGKFITSFDGFSGLNNEYTDIQFPKFKTPPAGEIKAKVAFAALEGDNNLTGDQFFFKSEENNKFSVLENSARKPKNFLNGSITIDENHFLNRNPDSKNTLGYDTGMLNIKNQDNLVIGNNAQNASLRMQSNGDRCYLFFTAFNVEVIDNELTVPSMIQQDYASKEMDLSEFLFEKKSKKTSPEKASLVQTNSTEINAVTIDGFPSGYYIIANVFEKEYNLKNFLTNLNAKGILATSFYNPNNKYNYVYLAKTDDKSKALELYHSKLNNSYKEPIWLLSVNRNSNSAITNLDD